MRSYEFVADRLILESLLKEEFKMAQLPDSYGGGWGVVDAEGNVRGQFDNEGDAKRFMDQKNAELKTVGGNAGKPEKFTKKELLKRVAAVGGDSTKLGVWGAILGGIQAIGSLAKLLSACENYHEYLLSTDVCNKNYDVKKLSRKERLLVQDYVAYISDEVTDGIISTFAVAISGAVLFTYATRILALFAGPVGWVGALIAYGSSAAILYFLQKFIENSKTQKRISRWVKKYLIDGMFMGERYVQMVCNDKLPSIPGLNEGVSVTSTVDFSDIFDEIAQDKKMQSYIKQALQAQAEAEKGPIP